MLASAKMIASGCKELSDSGESWINWWLFSPDVTSQEIAEFCDNYPSHVGYPGSMFSHSCTVRRSPSRVLIRQYGGYDV